MRLRWTKPALRDLGEIGDFIARRDPGAAARTVSKILHHAGALATRPQLGRVGRPLITRWLRG